MTVQELARRIEKLEQTVAELARPAARSGAWYVSHAGQFKNDPVYVEIVKRGHVFVPSRAIKGIDHSRHRHHLGSRFPIGLALRQPGASPR